MRIAVPWGCSGQSGTDVVDAADKLAAIALVKAAVAERLEVTAGAVTTSYPKFVQDAPN